jgi:hypothetical protein
MNLEKKLRDLNKRVGEDLSLLEFEEICDEVKKVIPDSELGLSNEERILVKELLNNIFYKRISLYKSCRFDWESGKFSPNKEELKYLKKHHKEFPSMSDYVFKVLEEQSPHLIDNFRRIKKSAEEDNKQIGKLLKNDEPRQKAEDLLKKYKDNPPSSGNNSDKDIENKFSEQITNLQNQIKDLENRQNQDSNLEKDHKYKKELERLKSELEELKNKKKDETQNKKGLGSDKKNNFPTG